MFNSAVNPGDHYICKLTSQRRYIFHCEFHEIVNPATGTTRVIADNYERMVVSDKIIKAPQKDSCFTSFHFFYEKYFCSNFYNRSFSLRHLLNLPEYDPEHNFDASLQQNLSWQQTHECFSKASIVHTLQQLDYQHLIKNLPILPNYFVRGNFPPIEFLDNDKYHMGEANQQLLDAQIWQQLQSMTKPFKPVYHHSQEQE